MDVGRLRGGGGRLGRRAGGPDAASTTRPPTERLSKRASGTLPRSNPPRLRLLPNSRTLAVWYFSRPPYRPMTRNEVLPLTALVTWHVVCSEGEWRRGRAREGEEGAGQDQWAAGGQVGSARTQAGGRCGARQGRAARMHTSGMEAGVKSIGQAQPLKSQQPSNLRSHLAAVALDQVFHLAPQQAVVHARHDERLVGEAVGVAARRGLRRHGEGGGGAGGRVS